jgi:predicted nuclease of restriction endonuclease-like (RecB) superfamily
MKLRVAKKIYKRWVNNPVKIISFFQRGQLFTVQRDRWKKRTLQKILESQLYQRFLSHQVSERAW